MHPRTLATLNELKRAQWFGSVGVRDTDAARIVFSWEEAIEHCGSVEWENLCLEARNQYCERLAERSPQRFQQWNDITKMLKPDVQALVREKAAPVVEANNLPKVFVDTIDWDILGVCMEAEYADVHPPGFFASQAYWYIKGHFPCGWEGDFPNGRLIIY